MRSMHPFGDARHLAHPDRRTEDQDVGVQDCLADVGPCVALAFVGGDARHDVEIRDADRLG